MNNKGQSLVLFVLMIPLVLMVIIMVYEVGEMVILKQEIDDINYMAIKYGVDKLDSESLEDKVKEVIIKNKKDVDEISILIEDNKLYVSISDSIDNKLLLGGILTFKVKSDYVGYIENEKVIIERNN